jgi:hypothetical protein
MGEAERVLIDFGEESRPVEVKGLEKLENLFERLVEISTD